jgi:hypothetical protein
MRNTWNGSRQRELITNTLSGMFGADHNLTLHTGAFNANARGFYAALGFVEEEVRLTRPVPDVPVEPSH